MENNAPNTLDPLVTILLKNNGSQRYLTRAMGGVKVSACVKGKGSHCGSSCATWNTYPLSC